MTQDGTSHTDTTGNARRSAQDTFRELWSQALVTVGGAEEEVRKLLDRVVEVADFHPEDVQRFGRELAERLKTQRKDLEVTLEEGVKQAVARLRIPSPEDLQTLKGRVEALADRIGKLEKRRPSGSPSKPKGKGRA
jgi:polyhydroxyalkanoate synthesis regulator phasin